MVEPPGTKPPDAETLRVTGAVRARRGGGLGGLWPALQPAAEARALALQFQFRASEWWPPERLLEAQLAQAGRVIRHAAATVPFYRDRLGAAARLPAGRLSMDAFWQIPILAREEIQAAGAALATTARHPGTGPVFRSRPRAPPAGRSRSRAAPSPASMAWP